MLRFVLFLVLAMACVLQASAAVVRIADGDCTGLTDAVTTASQSPPRATTILLAHNGTYASCGVNLTAGNVVLDGQGATVQNFSACVGSPDNPAPDASLTLRNLTVNGAASNCADGGHRGIGGGFLTSVAFFNTGTLNLESVSMQGGVVDGLSNGLILSSGVLALRNVSLTNIQQMVSFTYYLQAGSVGSIIYSSGSLEIYNSTFSNSSATVGGGSVPIIAGAQIKIANSLFAANASPACDKPVASLGGNIATDSSCGFSTGNGDNVVQDAGLGSFANHGGLVPTQAISSTSPAHGVGIAQYCEALDARGYARAANGCDAGAYEYGGGAGALTASGLNGLYSDPNADGHYVSLQRIHDNGDIAVIWNTFDQQGNQAWVYGVGQLSGQHIHAAMSQNTGGVLQVGGPATGSTVRSWGSVDIDLTSCLLAQFNYQSGLANFGSGQFPLTRLALVSDFGCSQ